MKYSELLGRRRNTFEKTYDLVIQRMETRSARYNIVELGTSRSFVSGDSPGCMSTDIRYWRPEQPRHWDWGAGVFTKVFSENLAGRNFRLHTVDPDENAIRVVSVMCGADKNIGIVRGYSTEFLGRIDFKIDLLYMDHMESGEESCIQHLKDSKYVVENNLMSENAMILIDDVGDATTETKGKYSIPYLLDHGYKTVLAEYQVVLERCA